MNSLSTLLTIFEGFFNSSSNAINFLFTPLPFINTAPAVFIGFSGLAIYLAIAVPKWFLS